MTTEAARAVAVWPRGGWNTWDPQYPARFVHLPSGFAIGLAAFTTRENRSSRFPLDPAGMRLGPHTADGSFCELELTLGGSRVRLRLSSTGWAAMVGEVDVLHTAEWGLRFWFSLEAGFAGQAPGTMTIEMPAGQERYRVPPVVVGTWNAGSVAFTTDPRPVGAHFYDDPAEAGRELEYRGYYARPPTRDGARWAVYRFNAVTPHVAFAAAVGDEEQAARRVVRQTVATAGEVLVERRRALASESHRLEAIRDVLGWNTVWDPVNGRPYTAATRAWIQPRFGGWAVWQLDAFLASVLHAAIGDRAMAAANLEAALTLATKRGNLAALLSGTTQWVDRSHPPIGALAAWTVSRRSRRADVLERAYPVLHRAFRWWFAERDGNGNGLLEYGSSPAGDGHFVHTKLAAMDESAMDNSPVHDEAVFDERTHTLDVEDVGLNSLLVLEAALLARMAEELGRPEEAEDLRAGGEALGGLVRDRLWDPGRAVFANRRWDGTFVRSLAPTSFYPLVAGIATPEQARVSVHEHLLDPRRFGGTWPVAGTPHHDPAAADNVYWRGRVWPPFNYLVYLGLRRYGFDEAASELARRSEALFLRGWADRRSYENFNQRTGEGGDSVDSDPFYSWGALLLLPAELEKVPVDPVFGLPV